MTDIQLLILVVAIVMSAASICVTITNARMK